MIGSFPDSEDEQIDAGETSDLDHGGDAVWEEQLEEADFSMWTAAIEKEIHKQNTRPVPEAVLPDPVDSHYEEAPVEKQIEASRLSLLPDSEQYIPYVSFRSDLKN